MNASVEFLLGGESVTVPLQINLDSETIITGDFAGAVPVSTTARLRGNVNLTGNLHVRGTLTCDPSGVNLNGNGFDIHTHDGTLNLQGVEKSAWVWWGDPVVGWQTGDRLAVAPTKQGTYAATETVWAGSWATMTRPVNSPDVTLLDGRVMKPEVANLSQTVTLRNLQRIMIHEATAPNPQTFKWIRVLDSGETGVLGMYPIHFHMIGDYARGSIHEGVVVEGGRHHAFVPHGSHGITYHDCVAYKSQAFPFWWDLPLDEAEIVNNSDDTTWERCLALGGSNLGKQSGAFNLGAGSGNSCIGSVVAGFLGLEEQQSKDEVNGFSWPMDSSQNIGGNVWLFEDNVAHNNSNGIRIWQNDGNQHILSDTVAYNNRWAGILQGAYNNSYRTERTVVQGGTRAVGLFASGLVVYESLRSDKPVEIRRHFTNSASWTEFINCQVPGVIYTENVGVNPSQIRYIDCGLVPANFTLTGILPGSRIEIIEAGVIIHKWAAGVWT